ncbi:tail protein X [Notoacmeibacter ruber]|uniref:Phage tail protein n=1 Tax=Notoacmeibacter ruber TaxID=2670375 RepID=A0A3L7JDR3_9HYPH|nr:tail protein X [Notoacmeibacter ruber]RLQ88928.1 hypothetical protein D8780_12505 [Notoacmeibacter ruber]
MRRAVTDAPIRLDRLAKSLFGSEQSGTVEALLAANPLLALSLQVDFVVPAGTVLSIPETVETPADRLTRPWE